MNLRRTDQIRRRTYVGFALFSALFAAGTLLLVGNPVTMVTIAALISLGAAPILYTLNLYCVRHHIDDPALAPGRLTVVLAWCGVAFVTGAFVISIYLKLFK